MKLLKKPDLFLPSSLKTSQEPGRRSYYSAPVRGTALYWNAALTAFVSQPKGLSGGNVQQAGGKQGQGHRDTAVLLELCPGQGICGARGLRVPSWDSDCSSTCLLNKLNKQTNPVLVKEAMIKKYG